MNKSNHFPPEVSEHVTRMVQEHRNEYPSQWIAIESIAPKIGCVPQTLHDWVRRHKIDTGLRDGWITVQAWSAFVLAAGAARAQVLAKARQVAGDFDILPARLVLNTTWLQDSAMPQTHLNKLLESGICPRP